MGQRIVRGAFWSLAGAIISKGMMLVASIFVARMLGKEGFGEVGIIRSTIQMFSLMAGINLGLTATKHVAEFRKNAPERAGRIIFLSTFVGMAAAVPVSLGVYVWSDFLAERALGAPHLGGMLRVGTILLVLNMLNGVQTGTLAGFEAFRAIAMNNFVAGVLSFPILLVSTYLYGALGFLCGLSLVHAAQALLNHVALRKEAQRCGIPVFPSGIFKEWPILLSFSLPAAMSAMILGPANWVCKALLANQPGGYAELGVFNAAFQWRELIVFLPVSMNSVALPMLTGLLAENQVGRYMKLLRMTILVNTGIAAALAFPIVLAAPLIMSCYGEGFADQPGTLRLLALSGVFIAASYVTGQAITSTGQVWTRLILHPVFALMLIGSAYLLLSREGSSTSLAFSHVLAYSLHFAWQFLTVAFLLRQRRVQSAPARLPQHLAREIV